MTERRQVELPFAEAEASRADRRNLLGLALTRADADLYMATFVRWVFNMTDGQTAPMIKSYQELAARPWGLCCSVTKVRSTVGRARQLGLVEVREERYVSGGQRANAYKIDWDGCRRLLGFRRAVHPRSDGSADEPGAEPAGRPVGVSTERDTTGEGPSVPAVAREQGGVATRQPPVVREQGGVATRHPYKENPSLCPSLDPLFSVPEPVPEPTADAELAEMIRRAPLLAEAAERTVRPLPAEGLFRCGVYAELADRCLRRPTTVIQWFRLQLSAPAPACGPTEAELLLVLAAAAHAVAIPGAEVRKSRTAAFVAIVSRKRWQRVQTQLPAVSRGLDRLLARFGRELLEGQTWPPVEIGGVMQPKPGGNER